MRDKTCIDSCHFISFLSAFYLNIRILQIHFQLKKLKYKNIKNVLSTYFIAIKGAPSDEMGYWKGGWVGGAVSLTLKFCRVYK